jgi:uncharacterized OB-fold protein
MSVKAFASGFLTNVSDDLDNVRLIGSECRDCGTGFFGTKDRCENCAGQQLEQKTLGTEGEIYSYTIQRYPPSKPFKMGTTDKEDWEPRPVAYVDVDGVRILSIIEAGEDEIEIGDTVHLVVEPGWEDEEGEDVLVYKFAPEGGAQ